MLVLLAGCGPRPQRSPVIGQAYAGPAVLNLRRDIGLDSPVATSAHHGDRLDILQRRRVFLKVRTAHGAEGWTEARQLLAAGDMEALNDLAARAARMPSQGQGMSYNDLNVHTQPSRQAPSFLLIKAKEKFAVLGHALVPDTELPRAPLIPPAPKKPKAPPKKSTASKLPPPPMPKPPSPPPDWLDLSRTETGEEPATEPAAEAPVAKPLANLDWSLVHTAEGPIGWVLTRRITMAIPDEVAQYAEGHRIVAYFSLGSVMDGDEKKDTWLWTTVSQGQHPYDFDSLRIFIWSLHRHRYETAHIERNLEGYLPVLLEEVPISSGKGKAAAAKYPGFSVCVEKDGNRYRRQYAMMGQTVRPGGQEACELPPPLFTMTAAPATATPASGTETAPAGQRAESWFGKIRRLLQRRR